MVSLPALNTTSDGEGVSGKIPPLEGMPEKKYFEGMLMDLEVPDGGCLQQYLQQVPVTPLRGRGGGVGVGLGVGVSVGVGVGVEVGASLGQG